MPCPDSPRLRDTISGQADAADQNFVLLFDTARISRHVLRIRREAVAILELFTGENTLRDIQAELIRRSGGQLFPIDILEDMVGRLDEALFLEGDSLQAHYAAFLQSPLREPACIGAYAGEAEALRKQLDELFAAPKGPGRPKRTHPSGAFRGALLPHIDFHRGGHTFAWGYKELIEHCDADVFVILGTSHYSRRRFTLTSKDFQTPLGLVETDKEFVDRLARHYGDGLFEDETAHLPEHSIEFHAVWLRYALDRPFRIVPLLVGSFHDCIHAQMPPSRCPDIARMITALQKAEADSAAKVCYIASGDLAHLGPKFGDSRPVDAAQLDWCERQDRELLRRAEHTDLAGFLQLILDEQDARRTCGFPPTYTLMAAAQPDRAKLLHYDRYVDPGGFESVSFASLAFYHR